MAEDEPVESTRHEPPSGAHVDAELELYRSLLEVPDVFEEGFNRKTVLGALFVSLIMVPASIYLGLLAGVGIGSAAQWVTVILFTEIARRSFTQLTRQEVFILLYVTGAIAGSVGGPFYGLIWNQYLLQSPAARGFQIADQIPRWVVPEATSLGIVNRTFLHVDWLVPIALLVIGTVIGRVQQFGLGYALFRVTSDVERLPFPFAAIAAQGSMALAEHTQKQATWRWHVFATGAVIGMSWAFFYIFIPALSGAVLTKPIQLITIPFIDLTLRTEKVLPGVATGISTDFGLILNGFVMPFWGVVGGAGATLVAFFVNPHLVRSGGMPHWEPGMDTIQTSFVAWQDYWLAAGIGITIAIALVGFWEVGKNLTMSSRAGALSQRRGVMGAPPKGRGDYPIWVSILIYVVTIGALVVICVRLIQDFPVWWLLFFGFVYTPLMSYITARLMGLIGQGVDIPMIREISFIVSGYKGAAIWFAPIPIANYGGQAQFFRTVELTGTRITSLMKAEGLMLPLILGSSFLFWQFIWRLAPIPSATYPFAQKFWPLYSMQSCLWMTATTENNKFFLDAAWKPSVTGLWLAVGLGGFIILSALRLPTMFVYGFIRGAGNIPHGAVLELSGALLSRFYFERRHGLKQWKLYAPVLSAGYACGMGLIGMAGAALAMVIKSTKQLPY